MAANIVKYILDIDSKKAKTGLKNLTNESKNTSKSLKTVPERIGDRLDALEIKIEAILDRIK